MDKQPFISIIIPIYNGSRYINQCLDALLSSSYPYFEIIVVDDGSTDCSADIVQKKGVSLVKITRNSTQFVARNLGAQKARGDIFLFVDCDVTFQRQTLARVADNFMKDASLGALFGSYDDEPLENNFCSQYKNLCHHFVHQNASHEAATFWSGCGAIRRDIFREVGGFDTTKYLQGVRDIELGYRLKARQHKILLDKELKVKHLKRWRFFSLVYDDIFYKAIPWSDLILKNRCIINDLNLKLSDRISAGLVGVSIVLLPFTLSNPPLVYLVFFFLASVFILKYKLYRFFISKRGLKFTILAFPMHLLYYFYSGITFMICCCKHVGTKMCLKVKREGQFTKNNGQER